MMQNNLLQNPTLVLDTNSFIWENKILLLNLFHPSDCHYRKIYKYPDQDKN